MARIERFTSRIEAEMACAMLTANGITARVSADDAGGVHPDIPFGIGGTAVVVPDDQLDEARALLDAKAVPAVEADPTSGAPAAGPSRSAGRLVALLAIGVVGAIVLLQVAGVIPALR